MNRRNFTFSWQPYEITCFFKIVARPWKWAIAWCSGTSLYSVCWTAYRILVIHRMDWKEMLVAWYCVALLAAMGHQSRYPASGHWIWCPRPILIPSNDHFGLRTTPYTLWSHNIATFPQWICSACCYNMWFVLHGTLKPYNINKINACRIHTVR